MPYLCLRAVITQLSDNEVFSSHWRRWWMSHNLPDVECSLWFPDISCGSRLMIAKRNRRESMPYRAASRAALPRLPPRPTRAAERDVCRVSSGTLEPIRDIWVASP